MNPNFAKGPCPVCGETAEWRVNKNGIVYSYCPNNHLIKLGRKDSTAIKDALKAGNREYRTNKIYLKGLENDRTEQPNRNDQPGAGINYGRPNGQPTAPATNTRNEPDNDDAGDPWDIF